MSSPRLRYRWWLAGSMVLLGCVADDEPTLQDDEQPPTAPSPPDEPDPEPEQIQCDIPSLFEVRCGGSICHSAGLSTAADLDLTSPGVEGRVAGRPGTSCAGTLAEPADPEGSLLYLKVLDTPSCGARMPLNGAALTDGERTCLRDWISGLLPDGGEDEPDDTCPNCACEPDAVESCYSGPDGTADIGQCKSGTRICGPDGAAWSGCQGEVLPRGENCFTDVDENCDGATPECSERWSLGFGDEHTQVMRSVAVDSKGNVYSAGDFEGVVSFGGEPLVASGDKADIVIAKHDRYGNPLWSKRFGDSSNQFAAKIVIDSDDNLIFVGRVYGHTDFGGGPLQAAGSGDVIVAKLDSDGDHLWSEVYGGKDPERAERVAIAGNDDVILTGTFTSNVDFGDGVFVKKGMRDAFVLRLDGDTGAHVFSRQIGGSGDDYGFGVDVDKSGHIIVAGRFQQSISLGGTLTSAGGTDLYVASLTAGGSVDWKKKFGGAGDEELHDLVISPKSGEIVLLGAMEGTVNFGAGKLVSAGNRDVFILGLDSDGDPLYSANYGDKGDQFGISNDVNSWMTLTADKDGFVYFGGPLIGTLDFDWFKLKASGTDIFYVALGAGGAPLWGYRYGSIDADLALDLEVDGNHMLMAGRSFGREIDFGSSGVVETHGGSDGLTIKLPL
ncbi:MAG TPA: hypothetical protein VK034_22200 [Enhygromyxa sp.]|nr:hypothetical protein [Enhygromyxa sp.]